jgi:hypothetical protein
LKPVRLCLAQGPAAICRSLQSQRRFVRRSLQVWGNSRFCRCFAEALSLRQQINDLAALFANDFL